MNRHGEKDSSHSVTSSLDSLGGGWNSYSEHFFILKNSLLSGFYHVERKKLAGGNKNRHTKLSYRLATVPENFTMCCKHE